MMKLKVILILVMFVWLGNVNVFAQCNACTDELVKDFLIASEGVEEQLTLLHFISKPLYQNLKMHYPEDSIAPLVFILINQSKDFDDFIKKRKELFEFTTFMVADENIQTALRNSAHEITYNHYAKCIDECYSKTPDKIYAVLTKTEESHFYVKVKFNNGTGSKVWVNLSASSENALVQKQDGTYYTANLTLRLNKNKEQELTFKRGDKNNFSGYKIMVDGKEIDKGLTQYKERKSPVLITVSTSITSKDSINRFIRTESAIVHAPNLYKVMSNDSVCKAKRGFAKGMWCAVKNTIELPNLPALKNIYYTNFSKPEPISTEKKEAAYGKFNKIAGLREIQKTGEGNKSAKIDFTTTSGNCTWQWSADVYEFSEKLIRQQKAIVVSNNLFTVDVPEHAVEATIILKINGIKYEMKAGNNNKDAVTYLISTTKKLGIISYHYFMLN